MLLTSVPDPYSDDWKSSVTVGRVKIGGGGCTGKQITPTANAREKR